VPSRRKASELTQDFGALDYLSDICINEEFDHMGEPLKEVEEEWHLENANGHFQLLFTQ